MRLLSGFRALSVMNATSTWSLLHGSPANLLGKSGVIGQGRA